MSEAFEKWMEKTYPDPVAREMAREMEQQTWNAAKAEYAEKLKALEEKCAIRYNEILNLDADKAHLQAKLAVVDDAHATLVQALGHKDEELTFYRGKLTASEERCRELEKYALAWKAVSERLAPLAQHGADCTHLDSLPTGIGTWGCSCGLDSMVLDHEIMEWIVEKPAIIDEALARKEQP